MKLLGRAVSEAEDEEEAEREHEDYDNPDHDAENADVAKSTFAICAGALFDSFAHGAPDLLALGGFPVREITRHCDDDDSGYQGKRACLRSEGE